MLSALYCKGCGQEECLGLYQSLVVLLTDASCSVFLVIVLCLYLYR